MRPIFKDPLLQAEYEDKGYVVIDFLDSTQVASLQNTYTELNGQPVQMGFSTSNMSMNPEYRKAVSDAILDGFNAAVDKHFDRCKMFFGIFTSKQANQERSICSMHQDPTYVDESKYHGMTIWVPLVDTDEHNGALEVIDRSHLLNSGPRGTFPRFPYQELVPLFLDKYFKRLDIKAGQAYIGNSKVLHWSPANRSNIERVAAISWMSEEESQMRCYYQDFQNPGDTMEVFELDQNHYVEAPLFSRPDENKAKKIEDVPYYFEPLNEEKIESILNDVTVS